MTDKERLNQLVIAFHEAGGRNIDLAERIDQLRESIDAPLLRTQRLLINLDLEINQIHDQGIPTSDITFYLDELWTHLEAQGQTKKIPDEELEELRDNRDA